MKLTRRKLVYANLHVGVKTLTARKAGGMKSVEKFYINVAIACDS